MTMRVDYKGMMIHGSATEIVAFIRLYDGQHQVKPMTIPPWDVPFKPMGPWKPDLYAKTTSGGTTVPKVCKAGDLTYEPLAD